MEYTALLNQAERVFGVHQLPMPELDTIRSVLLKLAEKAIKMDPVPEEKVEEEIRQSVLSLNPKASPGMPYCVVYKTNADLVAGEGMEFLVQAALHRRRILRAASQEVHKDPDSVQRVVRDLCDPVRVFTKMELHKMKKITEGLERKIFVVSVIDQIIERSLTFRLHKREISNYASQLVMPGMGLHDDGLRTLWRLFKSLPKRLGTDVSSWDWVYVVWLGLSVASLTCLQFGLKPNFLYPEEPITLIEARMYCLLNSLLVLSDGRSVAQFFLGLMKSGSSWTARFNSWGRVVYSALMGAELQCDSWTARAMGDDCVEDFGDIAPDRVAEVYQSHGIPLKTLESGDTIEFCSYVFDLSGDGVRCWPARPEKLVGNYLFRWSRGVSEAIMACRREALEYELRHHPEREKFLSIADEAVSRAVKACEAAEAA